MPDKELTSRMDAVERLVELFRLERMVHITVVTVGVLLLLVASGYLIWKNSADAEILIVLFGSSGLIWNSASHLLRMWNQSLEVLTDE